MIIWLNGTSGVGKTATAQRLRPLMVDSRLFDPETVGTMLRENLPDRPVADFQDWPAWRKLVMATASEIVRLTGAHLIIPYSVLTRRYIDQILGGLRKSGHDVFHVLLDADEAILRRRIEAAGETAAWRLDHLGAYRAAREWLAESADLVVDTAARTPSEIARQIATAADGRLTPADRKPRGGKQPS